MKKILSIALIAFLSASFITVSAGKKKKKETVQEKPVLVLTTGSDTLSYAAGYANTEGLIPFLLNQKVDTAYIADFIRGLNEYFVNTEDPAVVAYRKGLEIGQMLQQRAISGIANELKESPDSLVMDIFLKGFNDALENDTTIYNMETAKTFFNNRMQADIAAKKEMKYGKNREAGAAFLAENAKKEGVKVTASGLQYKVIEAGKGEIPTATQTVRVKYEGKLIDGTVFDSSYKRSDPITEFPCNRVIKGWTEALTMMPAGSKWELYIPYDLAYGDQDMGQIPPYSTLIFTVELVEIKK